MTLSAEEFIRRFLLHALPDGFHRIRYYGFLGNRYRQRETHPMPPTTGHGNPRTAFRAAAPGLPGSARRTHRNFAAPVSGMPSRSYGNGRVVGTPQIAGIQKHIMSSIAAIIRSRTPQVRSTDVREKPCPPLRQNLMLTHQSSKPDASQPVGIATSPGINCKATFFHRVSPLISHIPRPIQYP